MKKLFIALLVIGLIVAVNVNAASANAGPHGNYDAVTDECARCHRAHTGDATGLIKVTATDICMSCHDGTGADTDVNGGTYVNSPGDASDVGEGASVFGSPLTAGGFVSSYDQHSAGPKGITSVHTMGVGTAWTLAAGGTSSSAAISAVLSCSSCHDPHGNGNYRMLKEVVNGVSLATVTDFDTGASVYTTEAWTDDTIDQVCGACHTNYHDPNINAGNTGNFTHTTGVDWNDSSGNTTTINSFASSDPDGTGNQNYTAAGGDAGIFFKLPLAGTTMTCNTCHFSHGSAADMTTAMVEGATVAAGDGDFSALLRLDDRTTCQVCHAKGDPSQ